MADQLARGIFARFQPSENPFRAPNGMEDNLRLIDDHLALYTVQPPVPRGSDLPPAPVPGLGQIYEDGGYAVFNGGEWRNYPGKAGLRVVQLNGADEYFSKDGASWVSMNELMSTALDVRRFDVWGDGTIEASKLYRALDKAVAKRRPLWVPTGSVGYYAGVGGWDFRGADVPILGEGMPAYSSGFDRLQPNSGTIFFGTVDQSGSRASFFNAGVDTGPWFRANIGGGRYEEGLRNTAAGDPAILTTYNRDWTFANVRVLLPPAIAEQQETWGHCLLAERLIGVQHGYIECRGGFHGYALKSQKVSGGAVVLHAQIGSTYVIKSDDESALAGDIEIESITVGHPLDPNWTGGTGKIESKGLATRNVNIQLLRGRNCDTLLLPAGTGAQVVGVSIGHFEYTDGNQFVAPMKIDGRCLDWKIGTHRIRDVRTGIEMTGGQTIDIGSGSVTNSRDDGYVLKGDVTHGVLHAHNAGGYAVRNDGAFGVEPSRIVGTACALGTISALSDFSDSVALNAAWQPSGGFGAAIAGGEFRLRGSVVAPAGATSDLTEVLTISAPYKPKSTIVGLVAAFKPSTNERRSLVFELYDSGALLVYGATDLGANGRIYLNTIRFMLGVVA